MNKHLFFLAALCSLVFTANAQKLIIDNRSCTDVNVVVYADDNGGSNCGPTATDYSTTITVTSGNLSTFNFNGGNTAPSFSWANSGVSVPFNIFKADVANTCNIPSGIGCGYPQDGITVDNPNCNPSTSNLNFENSTPCGTCPQTCVPPTCPGCGGTIAPPINVVFTMSGSDWVITIN